MPSVKPHYQGQALNDQYLTDQYLTGQYLLGQYLLGSCLFGLGELGHRLDWDAGVVGLLRPGFWEGRREVLAVRDDRQ